MEQGAVLAYKMLALFASQTEKPRTWGNTAIVPLNATFVSVEK